jgi:flagellar biogenesis protein FliO
VGIGGQILVLGISEAQITLLDKIENQEFVKNIEAQHPAKSEPLTILDWFSLRNKGLSRGPLRILNGK